MLRKWIFGFTWTVLRLFGAALIKEGIWRRMKTSMLKLGAMFNSLVTSMVVTVTYRRGGVFSHWPLCLSTA